MTPSSLPFYPYFNPRLMPIIQSPLAESATVRYLENGPVFAAFPTP